MGKYGAPPEYNYRLKKDAVNAKKAAQSHGCKARVTGSRGLYHVIVTNCPRGVRL